ncbi:DUF6113 family protein [Microbacterium luticocti]|uniref:DUF6113 family protein n=1 Tax=Microbacterium luticocti TaxID=451764 RepID=UPI000422F184|nr:DUF6113 family protein [Microbacterium luticocti]
MSSPLSRLLTWLVALVVGAVYGTAGTFAHAYLLGPVPVGLLLALIGLAAMLTAVRTLTGDRWSALAAGVGALAVTVMFSGSGPGGSVVMPGGPLGEWAGVNIGIVWQIGVALVATLAVAWPNLARPHPEADN